MSTEIQICKKMHYFEPWCVCDSWNVKTRENRLMLVYRCIICEHTTEEELMVIDGMSKEEIDIVVNQCKIEGFINARLQS